ncbi:MAG: hypothetical protein ACK5JS_03540 [Mangrovibacterium sp.]
MNIRCSLLLMFFAWHSVLSAATYETVEKSINTSCAVQEIDELIIDNQYGNVVVTDLEQDSIYVNVIIKVTSKNQSGVDQILNKVKIHFQQNGKQLKAETSIDNLNLKNASLEINYNVVIPASKKLEIINKYGNVQVAKLEAEGKFDLKYGNLTGGEWKTSHKIPINVSYGNVNIEEVTNAAAELSYGDMNIGKIENLYLNSKYSDVNITEGQQVQFYSKYDKFKGGKIGTINSEAKYTDFKIEHLTDGANVITSYGNIAVREVLPSADSLMFELRYTNVKLGLGANAYHLDCEGRYSTVKLGDGRKFNGLWKTEGNYLQLKGEVGDNPQKLTLRINANYGDINLAY